MNRLREIEARLAEIRGEIETRGAELNAEQLTALENEVNMLQEERNALIEAQERRTALLSSLANSNTVDDGNGNVSTARVVRNFNDPKQEVRGGGENVHPTDSPEYRTAFMNFVCRNVAMPREMRTSELTTVADTGAVIPNTIMKEIIRKLESYGNLYAKFRKLNIQGGVAIPIVDLKPEAKWIGETTPSDDQKLSAKDKVTFNYHGLECKIAQSILASIVTLEAFQELFVPLAAEAMVKAVEIASVNGDGVNKPLGITKDERVTTIVDLTEEDMKSWSALHKKVKAKIKKAYRTGSFIMNQATFDGYIDGMVDNQGQPVGRTNYGINGEETYRFMGKDVETTEDEIFPYFGDAEVGDIFGAFMNIEDYIVNTNETMTATKWTDHDENKVKNKVMMVIDGKIGDANGVILLRKAASEPATV